MFDGRLLPQTDQSKVDKAACEAYKALVKKWGGIPTGTDEAGARLYRQGNSVGFTDSIYQQGENSASRLLSIPLPNGATSAGYIHTHPSLHTTYFGGAPIPRSDFWRAQVSRGDTNAFDVVAPASIGYGALSGYITTPEMWKNQQILRFKLTSDGNNMLVAPIGCR